jgi:hypothetical protein
LFEAAQNFAQNFELFSNIQDENFFKSQKPIALDALFKA